MATAAKKTVAKKTTTARKPRATKSEILTTKPVEGDVDFVDPAMNAWARDNGIDPDSTPKIHAKHLSLMVTVGTEDRDRDIEEFYAAVEEAIRTLANAKRVTRASSYYILDGKVCLPNDYNPETQNFKVGSVPPSWAGGPLPTRTAKTSNTGSTIRDSRLSKEEGERRIAAGKAKYAASKDTSDDDGFEEIDWNAADADNDSKLTEVADESIESAVAELKKPRRVVKKSASARKTTVVKTPRKRTTKEA